MTEVPHLTGESKVGEAEKNLLSHLRTKMDHRGTRTRYRVEGKAPVVTSADVFSEVSGAHPGWENFRDLWKRQE